jgi:hypothetical protein
VSSFLPRVGQQVGPEDESVRMDAVPTQPDGALHRIAEVLDNIAVQLHRASLQARTLREKDGGASRGWTPVPVTGGGLHSAASRKNGLYVGLEDQVYKSLAWADDFRSPPSN